MNSAHVPNTAELAMASGTLLALLPFESGDVSCTGMLVCPEGAILVPARSSVFRRRLPFFVPFCALSTVRASKVTKHAKM